MLNAKKLLCGVWAPITTPFTPEQAVDLYGLEKNMQFYAQSGIQGYLALGSNGENRSLLGDEKQKVLRAIIRNKAPGQRVMAGCIAESTLETLELARMAEVEGADFITLLPPSYFADQMTDDVLLRYFTEVADCVSLPVLLYCAPQYSAGVVLSKELVKKAAQHPNIVGMKDSSSGNIEGYLNVVPEDFAVMAGSAGFFLHALELGATGGVLSLANVFPRFCTELYQAYMRGEKALYPSLNERLLRINKGVSGRGGVAAVKAAMNMAGLVGGEPRRPLLPLDPQACMDMEVFLKEEGML